MAYKVSEKNRTRNKHLKKENSLDYYILNNEDNISPKYDKNSEDEEQKHEFLKKNLKASSVIPRETEKYSETPDNLGYLSTRFGTIAVGNKKYQKNSPVVFSLVPESAKPNEGISDREVNSPNYYFGNDKKIRKKKFKASEVSFKYDPERSEIQKLKEDNDGVVDDEKELLYTSKKENDMIENLKKKQNDDIKNFSVVDKKIEKIRDIKKEKEEDNEDFLKKLDNFVSRLRKDKIKKRVDSDDAVMRRKRILELSIEAELQSLSLIELRKRLEELLKRKELPYDILKKYKSMNLGKLDKQEMITIIKELLMLGSEN
ncbi:MAG: hypothetical protein Q4D57_00700 [Clostridia bacterium]|nr:hypothetical protein [Clostridia bacterium]